MWILSAYCSHWVRQWKTIQPQQHYWIKMETELNSFRFYFFLVLKNRKLLISWLGDSFFWFFHADFLRINTCLFHTYYLYPVDNRYPVIFYLDGKYIVEIYPKYPHLLNFRALKKKVHMVFMWHHKIYLGFVNITEYLIWKICLSLQGSILQKRGNFIWRPHYFWNLSHFTNKP